MPRITAKLSDEQQGWVEQQAEQRDRSQAEIVRAAIDLARDELSVLRDDALHSDVQHSNAPHTSDLGDRVDDLEDRVAELEARLPELEPAEQWGRSSNPETEEGDAAIDDALKSWSPGRTTEERQARRESGGAVLEWVREQPEPVRASHVKEALYDEHGLEEQTEGTWWEMTARRALNHAAERGYIDDSGRSYEWTGGK